MRAMDEADRPAVLSFLRDRRDMSLFLLTGLEGYEPQPFRLWLAEGPAGVAGVLGLSGGGYLLPQWPGGRWGRARAALAGQAVAGAVGPLDQVAPLLAGLRLRAAVREEVVLALDLAALAVPPGTTRLLPDGAGDPALVARWRAAFRAELSGLAPALAAEQAARDVAEGLGCDRFRLLVDGEGAPVAMTGFTARADGTVLVGRVFVPQELRGRGHARRAVALHLAETRVVGTARAVLAASGPAAERAYRAIGFRPIDRAGMAEFESPRVVSAADG